MLSPLYWCYPPLYWRYPPLYWIPSTVLVLSPLHVLMLSPNVLNTLHSTEAILPLYRCYPPLYWTTSTVLKVSPTCTAVIPPQYWRYPSTVLMKSPHCTEQPPQCWSYPPLYWSYPPQYWCYPPDVLNNLQCTEQPPQYWTDVIWGEGDTLLAPKSTFFLVFMLMCCSVSRDVKKYPAT